VVEAVALGESAREVLGAEQALLDQTRSGIVPKRRASSIAATTRSRATKPRSTMTSVRQRAGPPGWRGFVIPS
jgi:hypothetical protein